MVNCSSWVFYRVGVEVLVTNVSDLLLAPSPGLKYLLDQDQDQRSELEAESQVQSTSDNVLHAVSIPAYETHRWKEDSCSPNLDGNLAQGTNKI